MGSLKMSYVDGDIVRGKDVLEYTSGIRWNERIELRERHGVFQFDSVF